MRWDALIRANFGDRAAAEDDGAVYAKLVAQAVWLEQYRLNNLAEMIAALFGGKK